MTLFAKVQVKGFQVYKRLNTFRSENSEDPGQTAAQFFHHFKTNTICLLGAQWLSGRVLDSRPKGRRFEPHRRHCVVVLEQDTFILA